MSTNSRFTQFIANLSISQSDANDAQTKYDGVARKLHSHYYTTAFDGSTRRLIGSYGKGTAVRPPRDVDILFMMPYSEYVRYNSYSGNGQSQLLQDIRAILQDRYSTTDGIRGDGQVVVVPFTGGHSVELLPAWRSTENKFIIPNTHAGGSWRTADHDAEISNVADSDKRSNGDTRRLIKMMKIWQAECNVPIKSIVLELRAVNFLNTWPNAGKGHTYYDWMVRDYLSELVGKVNAYCDMPGTTERCQYGDAWLSRAETARDRAIKACEFEAQNLEHSATIEWRKIFGSKYDF